MKRIMVFRMLLYLLILLLLVLTGTSFSQGSRKGKTTGKPLFRDPVYDGAADTTVIWNSQEKNILQIPGKGADDQVIGGHPGVVVAGDRADNFKVV